MSPFTVPAAVTLPDVVTFLAVTSPVAVISLAVTVPVLPSNLTSLAPVPAVTVVKATLSFVL